MSGWEMRHRTSGEEIKSEKRRLRVFGISESERGLLAYDDDEKEETTREWQCWSAGRK